MAAEISRPGAARMEPASRRGRCHDRRSPLQASNLHAHKRQHVVCRLTWLVAALTVSVAVAAFPAVPVLPVHAGALRKALFQGDIAAFMHAAKQQAMDPFWIELYSDQLGYRFPQMLATAKECRNRLGARRGNPRALQDAATCNRFALEAAYELGDAREYYDALAWRRRDGMSHTQRGRHGAGFRPLYPRLDITKLANSVPTFTLVIGSPAPTILTYADAGHGGFARNNKASAASAGMDTRKRVTPRVVVNINGRDVTATVDTGQNLALVMSVSESHAIGAKPLSPGFRGLESLAPRDMVQADHVTLALIPKFRLGPLQLDNLLAVVIPDRDTTAGKGSLTIGLPLLARFRSVEFRRSSMILNPAREPCPHGLPATFANAVGGHAGVLVFDAKMGYGPVKASVDTGSNVLLVAANRLLPSNGNAGATTKPTSAGTHNVVGFRYLAVRVAGLDLSLFPAPVASRLTFPDVLIGAPVLAGANIRFNFTPTPSVCLTRRLHARADMRHQQRKEGTRLSELGTARHALQASSSTSSDGMGMTRIPSFAPVSAFRTPLLKGMDMHPGRAVIGRYAPPPPPWLHFRFHCVIYHGNVYIDGSVTGNFGRPVPGETLYIGHGNSAIMAFTSNDSGHFDGVAALPAGPIATPANMARTPMQCSLPQVKVGAPSRAKSKPMQ